MNGIEELPTTVMRSQLAVSWDSDRQRLRAIHGEARNFLNAMFIVHGIGV